MRDVKNNIAPNEKSHVSRHVNLLMSLQLKVPIVVNWVVRDSRGKDQSKTQTHTRIVNEP